MKLQKFTDLTAALSEGRQLPFLYLRTLSAIQIGSTGSIALPEDMEEIEQLRFFGPECEIRIVRESGRLTAAKLEDADSPVMDERCELLAGFGTGLTKRKLLAFDEDGQASIAAVRLLKWEG